ncbi:MAG: hypothetical protein ACJ73S_28440, partial [Mycobacteriales bacterium]
KGKLAGVPVAVVRGLDYPRDDAGARPLVRPADNDLFRHGAVDAVYAALARLLVALAAEGYPAVATPDGGVRT